MVQFGWPVHLEHIGFAECIGARYVDDDSDDIVDNDGIGGNGRFGQRDVDNSGVGTERDDDDEYYDGCDDYDEDDDPIDDNSAA